MRTLTLLGASGYTGRLVARSLDRRGVTFVAAGRDPDRVRAAVDGLGAVSDVATADVGEPRTLRTLAEATDVLATTVGPFADLGRPVLDAAIAGRAHYLDSAGEQAFLYWAFHERSAAAGAAGVTAVPASGFDYLLGDLLTHVAAREVQAPREAHVAYLVRGSALWASRGTRASIAGVLGRPVLAYDGELVEEELGQTRRPTWFPRPVGPRHAVGAPGGEPLSVPRHVRGVQVVRTYVAVPGVLADLGQIVSAVARWGPVASALRRVLAAGPEGPSEAARRRVRWACVAEVTGEDGVARAWAYGHDVYGLTAEAMSAVAHRLLTGEAHATGVVAPAEAFAADELLDDLAAHSDLRWSVRAPGSAA
ncbi:MAG TPA: saccharopine dehydrogenase NADP-binding domain-containing protein [Nitriliruptorales bacterium]|nr:saccharopine dehydrogenase NADP-binding domain-containing protein [Nitriliruptorales bacterium]